MDATDPVRPRAVSIVGWVWLVAALMRLVNALLVLFVWRVGGLDREIPFFGTTIFLLSGAAARRALGKAS
jgi:hypothetical protein